ncbi:class I SAM-dependent methyltransferase [Mycolicibacterium chlorophenolicum]|uniref:S-adenosyl-L-methionine-dependent methyltransferase n=1 Tax=Mycolicibacterium chlorophenolicum TaxID=37916 RepID=A0A0J6VQB3_9MYCO|nr:class I SAM-dependent methyltransferase [Mycolicibacterium chlorophenolicum]KMO71667.1 putative S-adenosyl-L-methionine-dependent methyltransferase [Mycolicibacterium chlorophenolicum]
MSRTEGDTWDLASSVGATATSVAASRALASRGPDPLIDDPYADLLVEAVGVPHFVAVARGETDIPEEMREHIAVRTRFFDDVLTDAADAGVRQVVILASGLDTRAYRLPWPAGTRVFELDQPSVIEFKTRVLADAGVTPSATRVAVGVDLRDDWPKALQDNGFDAKAPTAWIAEGLLIYLPPEAQDRLLDHISALSAPGSVLATEHMDPKALTGEWAKQLSALSRRHGSDIDLSALFYTGPRTAAGDHLSELGWRVQVLPNAQAYAAHGFDPPTDSLIAMVGDSGYLSAHRE